MFLVGLCVDVHLSVNFY